MSADKNHNKTPEYIKTASIDDFESKIIEAIEPSKRGRFKEYRDKYQSSLNYNDKETVLDFPLTVHVELINKCNLSCQMCYVTNHSGSKNTLSDELIGDITKEAARHQLPAVIVGLGSEALLHKNVPDIFHQFDDAGVIDKFL